MDRELFVTLMKALCATKRVEATEAFLMGYWIGCAGLSDDDFRKAIERALRETDGFMPSPNELRKMGGEEQVETRAIHAWATVLRAIGSVGSYTSVDFGTLTNAVIRSMGGWVELCNRDSEELREFGRKDFEKTYRSLAGSTYLAEMGEYLPGICERMNKAIGAPSNVVRMLDAKQAPKLAAVPAEGNPS